ncbi:MAG: hypothetical protein ACK4VI_01165 [Alphaproteobacteria bacterium]
MYSAMQEWSVNIETHTRDDVMKVCALLARGIGGEAILKHRFKLVVYGTHNTGKSAIVDGLVSAFSDRHSCYKMSTTPLMESFAGEAGQHRVEKSFTVKGQECDFTLRHFLSEMDMGMGRWRPQTALSAQTKRSGIDFITLFGHSHQRNADLSIFFAGNLRFKKCEWPRKLNIDVISPILQNPQMAEVLEHLPSFHERRRGVGYCQPKDLT